MLFVFLLSDCKYLLYFWLRECLKVLFIIQSINMLESINNLHILMVFSRSFLAAGKGRESSWCGAGETLAGALLTLGSARSSR